MPPTSVLPVTGAPLLIADGDMVRGGVLPFTDRSPSKIAVRTSYEHERVEEEIPKKTKIAD